jgi:hypothetical protein
MYVPMARLGLSTEIMLLCCTIQHKMVISLPHKMNMTKGQNRKRALQKKGTPGRKKTLQKKKKKEELDEEGEEHTGGGAYGHRPQS